MLHPVLLASGIVPGTSDLLVLSTKGIARVPLCILYMLSCPLYVATSQRLAAGFGRCGLHSFSTCAMKYPAATPGHSEPCCLLPFTLGEGIS